MLVGRVTMEKFMLHQAGQLAEFGNVAAEKIHLMHHSQDASHSAFLRQNRFEDRARPPRILIGAGNLAEVSAQ